MMYAIPKSIFSWGFEVFDDDRLLAIIDTSWLVEGGSLDYDGITYQQQKDGFLSGGFKLLEDGAVIATAQKAPMMRYFDIDYANQHYILKAASIFTRKFIIQQNENTIGQICPKHGFTRKCTIDMPPEIPVPVQLFKFWLVALMWRRRSRNNNAAAG
jgi:hypothetical protein